VRIAVIFLVLLSWLPPSPANARPLSLYDAFDHTHNGHHGNPALPKVVKPPLVADDAFGGCGRGRNRDQATHRCGGSADLR
jgi:hypothetical protein